MIFPENLWLPVIVQGILERRHNFLIESFPIEYLFNNKPARGENQPRAGGGIVNRWLKRVAWGRLVMRPLAGASFSEGKGHAVRWGFISECLQRNK
jgi:hypothetical protein